MKYVPGFFVHNWKLKLSAVAMAVLLWGVMRQPASQGAVPNVPVRVQLDDEGWQLVGRADPPQVQVTFGGPSADIGNLQYNPPPVVIPVDDVHAGDTTVMLRNSWVELSGWPSVFVRSITPNSVRLRFDSVAVAAAPVGLRLTGELPQDLALAQPIATSPAVIRVRGAGDAVAAVDSVYLEPFDLSRVRSSGQFTVPVDTAGLSSLTVTPRQVEVTIQVAERVERVFGGVPVQPSEGDAEGLTAEPSTMQLTLRGALPRVRAVEPGALRVVYPAEAVQELEEGEEVRLPVSVDGVPDLVRVTSTADSVTVRREPPSDGEDSGPGG